MSVLINPYRFAGGVPLVTPSFIAVGTDVYDEISPIVNNVPYPAGVAANRIAFIFTTAQKTIGAGGAPATFTIGTPGGWNLLIGPVDGYDANAAGRSYGFWRRLTGSESGTVSISPTDSSNVRMASFMAIYADCKLTGNPFEGAQSNGTAGTASTNPVGSAVTTTGASRRIVNYINIQDNTAIATAGAGWDTRKANGNVGSGSSFAHYGYDKERLVAGIEAAHDPSNLATAERWTSISFALLPQE